MKLASANVLTTYKEKTPPKRRCELCKYCMPRSLVHDDEFYCSAIENDYFQVDEIYGVCNCWTEKEEE